MISFIRGTLFSHDKEKVIIDTGSLGYSVYVPASFLMSLPPIHSEIFLYTYEQVREDDMSLYGFPEESTLHLFELLLTISGIGPKGAMNILSSLPEEDFRMAVLASDTKSLSKVPGIGKKTAERIVLELSDKLAKMSYDSDYSGNTISEGNISEREEIITALKGLGFSQGEAYKAVSRVPSTIKEPSDILKMALKELDS